LAVGSLVGTVYILGSLALVFGVLPALWKESVAPIITNVFVEKAFLIVLMVAALAGLAVFGQRLVGPHPPTGLRAGIFAGVVGALLLLFLLRGIGGLVESTLPVTPEVDGVRQLDANFWMGVALTGVAGVVLVVVGVRLFFRPAFERWLVGVEEQGWFSATAYKRSQGQRVRRGTVLGLLILAGCGIYTLLAHKTLETSSTGNWELAVPFTGGKTLILLPHIQFTLPLLLAAGALWLAYRVVNYPTFADFLIATEAELNKVSWTTRKRLIQDTIVVLTTMILMTVFLFVVDFIWIKSLSWIQVLRPPSATQETQIGAQDW
jgi:preprotein translocase SecE subunit